MLPIEPWDWPSPTGPSVLEHGSDLTDLDVYFRDCVIGGLGSFVISVHERAEFVQAVTLKIIREVAGNSTMFQAASTAKASDSLVSERKR